MITVRQTTGAAPDTWKICQTHARLDPHFEYRIGRDVVCCRASKPMLFDEGPISGVCVCVPMKDRQRCDGVDYAVCCGWHITTVGPAVCIAVYIVFLLPDHLCVLSLSHRTFLSIFSPPFVFPPAFFPFSHPLSTSNLFLPISLSSSPSSSHFPSQSTTSPRKVVGEGRDTGGWRGDEGGRGPA